MRNRDSKHQNRLIELLKLNPEECMQRIVVSDYDRSDYVPSEVLASLIRVRFGESTGVLVVATKELHRRVIIGIERIVGFNNEITGDAAGYFWEKLLSDKQDVCNAEVRFYVYLKNKVMDYKKHLLTIEYTRLSVDAMVVIDDDGNEGGFIESVEDYDAETPEDALIRIQKHEGSVRIMNALSTLPQNERYAYFFRIHCDYDWKTVADFLGCSIPTARKYLNSSLPMLQGEL